MNHSQIPHPHDADGKPRQTPRHSEGHAPPPALASGAAFPPPQAQPRDMDKDVDSQQMTHSVGDGCVPPHEQPGAEATAGCLCTACPWPGLKFENADLQAEVEALTVRISHLHDAAALYARVEDENADLRARLAAAETREKTLAQWPAVFRDHFGPEGDDLAIADKGVQDLVAERNMAQSDKEAAERERDALRETTQWVIDDMSYYLTKAPELYVELVPVWWRRLTAALAPKEATE